METLPIAMTPWRYKALPRAKKQLKVIEGLLQPGMQVLTIGRMSVHPVYLSHHRANPDPQYFDLFDGRRDDREDPFNTHAVGNLPL